MNQLIKVTTGNTTAEYTYNGDGLRTSKKVNGVTTTHVWDGDQIALELDGNGNVTNKYVRGINLIYAENSVGTRSYYLFNGHGDVIQLTGTDGNVSKTYDYDAFGNEKNPDSNDTNVFRYCGEYFDKETNTIYLRARYYDPEIGRFISEDSVWGTANDPLSLNLYTYCANNPISLYDPSGKYYVVKNGNGTYSIVSETVFKSMVKSVIGWIPFLGDNFLEFTQKNWFNVVGGNSATNFDCEKKMLETIATDTIQATLKGLGKKLVFWYGVGDAAVNFGKGANIYGMDDISLSLLKDMSISTTGKNSQHLMDLMDATYNFVSAGSDYFMRCIGGPLGNKTYFSIDIEISNAKDPNKIIEDIWEQYRNYYISLGNKPEIAGMMANTNIMDFNYGKAQERLAGYEKAFKAVLRN